MKEKESSSKDSYSNKAARVCQGVAAGLVRVGGFRRVESFVGVVLAGFGGRGRTFTRKFVGRRFFRAG